MMKDRYSQARLAITALAMHIVGVGFMDIMGILICDWGILIWIVTVMLLCCSLIIFAYGEDSEFLLGPGIVLSARFIFNIFTVMLLLKAKKRA